MTTIVDGGNGATDDRHGVLVVGHGTRDAAGTAEFHEVARQLAERLGPTPVEPGILELAEPTIAVGIERLAERGVRSFTVAPLVLFAAGHAKRDIPETVAAAPAVVRHSMQWRQTPHLGLHPRLLELSRLRFDEAIADGPNVAPADTLLIVVGRGSSDPTAQAETREFARLRGAASSVGRVETAFTALCEPRLDDVLAAAAKSSYRRIVVQPHLLFTGELAERVRRQSDEAAQRWDDRDWRATRHLGPHPLLVEAVVERIAAGRT